VPYGNPFAFVFVLSIYEVCRDSARQLNDPSSDVNNHLGPKAKNLDFGLNEQDRGLNITGYQQCAYANFLPLTCTNGQCGWPSG